MRRGETDAQRFSNLSHRQRGPRLHLRIEQIALTSVLLRDTRRRNHGFTAALNRANQPQ
jgi:hypothetical protein